MVETYVKWRFRELLRGSYYQKFLSILSSAWIACLATQIEQKYSVHKINTTYDSLISIDSNWSESTDILDAEYLVFVSSRSLKTREKYTNWDNDQIHYYVKNWHFLYSTIEK